MRRAVPITFGRLIYENKRKGKEKVKGKGKEMREVKGNMHKNCCHQIVDEFSNA